MKDLLDYLVKSLVGKPDEVKIEDKTDESGLTFTLTVSPEDMGLVIGKGGQTIRSLRKMLTARAMAENSTQRVYLNLTEITPA
ncbi:hypothetical protein A3H85_03570 [Candidatus Daviesbacteria bacterium RIFCSPLOWO2_02_FULL_40_8]|uniref:RNA-binding protein KhpA n=1 Tax=Candidatus Daviesbacteria bacterium RIFCSPLOWO2_01_FULL_40_24 TaxID=1797787 RepID=A0A1F5MIW8_9BACT|nr:MAG: hypothetical protein A2780_03560 [Candidatus Daviesbacteria bacterium RIFCSPHIGHO2_01_FULL_41_45]OGE35546.1 MAG: hypothetical protein A3C32_03000 [Candidatus Daviesbacteria bacterium RIFCSPHIGHO2_02_FULL_41_14]OGE65295.1 MAG: hypothetical protein A3B49_00335 [Candidatus Daviesbacteria bacterium RIFCSPLOWO2_01_FULL_40_24]OGE66943.1 MAG: hypothetical protein A3H85_03570 [Candidatus Daviesbacteria bacterium RIFCSPLOWO2_02_FULL_40_8]